MTDGHLDGFVTPDQLQVFDPTFLKEAHEAGLLSATGILPYASLMDSFGKGYRFWSRLSFNIEDIPLIDAMRMGLHQHNMNQMCGGHRIDLINTDKVNSLIGLKTPFDLMTEILDCQDDDSHFNEVDEKDTRRLDEAISDFESTLTNDQSEPNPQILFDRALKKFLYAIGERKAPWAEKARGISVLKKYTLTQAFDEIAQLGAFMVYADQYVFPSLATCFNAQEIGVTFNPWQTDSLCTPNFERKQPFHSNVDGCGIRNKQMIYLRIKSTKNDDWSENVGGFNKIENTVTHERGHMLTNCYSPRQTDQAVWFASYFSNLPAEVYQVIFGTFYGHRDYVPVENPDYSSSEECHSELAQLVHRGFDFPEQVRSDLEKEGVGYDLVQEIYAMLLEWRSWIQKEWGYQRPPEWADQLNN